MLPAELRRRLDLRAGDEMRISEQADGALRVDSRRAAVRALIGSAGHAKRSMVDELGADRHRQAAVEDQDAKRGSR